MNLKQYIFQKCVKKFKITIYTSLDRWQIGAFEFFDINSIDRDSTFFVLMFKSLQDLKFTELCHPLDQVYEKDS